MKPFHQWLSDMAEANQQAEPPESDFGVDPAYFDVPTAFEVYLDIKDLDFTAVDNAMVVYSPKFDRLVRIIDHGPGIKSSFALLKEDHQADWEDFDNNESECYCHLGHPPCGQCTHPGNPIGLVNDDNAWIDLHD